MGNIYNFFSRIKTEFGEKPVQTSSLILGILVVFIGFFGWVFPRSDKLVVFGEYKNIQLPKEIMYMPTNFSADVSVPTTTLMYLTKMKSYMTVSLENDYNNTLKDVYVDIPFGGLYSKDDGKTTLIFSNEIKLGDLKPQGKTSILIYANEPVYDYSEDGIKVGYENGGVRVVRFPRQVYGFIKWIINYYYFLPIFLWLLWIVFIAICFFAKRKVVA
mgnify:CR=1 FL=1